MCSQWGSFVHAEDQHWSHSCSPFGLFGGNLHMVEGPSGRASPQHLPSEPWSPILNRSSPHTRKQLPSKAYELLTLAYLHCGVYRARRHNLLNVLVYVMVCSGGPAWVFASSSIRKHVLWGMLCCAFWQLYDWKKSYTGSLAYVWNNILKLKCWCFLGVLGGIFFTGQYQVSELICSGKSQWFFWYNYTGVLTQVT